MGVTKKGRGVTPSLYPFLSSLNVVAYDGPNLLRAEAKTPSNSRSTKRGSGVPRLGVSPHYSINLPIPSRTVRRSVVHDSSINGYKKIPRSHGALTTISAQIAESLLRASIFSQKKRALTEVRALKN